MFLIIGSAEWFVKVHCFGYDAAVRRSPVLGLEVTGVNAVRIHSDSSRPSLGFHYSTS